MLNRQELQSLIDTNPFVSLNSITYQYLFQKIITLEMEPESTINVTKIADILGLSRSPVQAAVEQLRQDGLVEKLPGKAMIVTAIKYSEYAQILQVRRAIEAEGAYYAAKWITAKNLTLLKELLQRSRNPDLSADDICAIDDQFHTCIIHSSQNKYFVQVYESFHSILLRYRHFATKRGLNSGNFYAMHVGLYNALKNHLSDQARCEVCFIIDSMNKVLRFLE